MNPIPPNTQVKIETGLPNQTRTSAGSTHLSGMGQQTQPATEDTGLIDLDADIPDLMAVGSDFKMKEKEEKAMTGDWMNTDPDSDGDEVVGEYDVVLTPELTKDLFLVQYPLRSKSFPFNESLIKGFRLKPKQKVLEMDIERAKDTRFFDEDAAKDYAFTGVDVFRSSAVPSRSNYAVASVRGGQIHMTPLTNIVQMRPAMEYVDGAESLRLAMERDRDSDSQEDTDGQSEGEAESKPTMVQVQIKKKESERAAAARKGSYGYLKQLLDEESFVPLQYHRSDEPNAAEARNRLFGDSKAGIQMDATPSEYLKILNPPIIDTPVIPTPKK